MRWRRGGGSGARRRPVGSERGRVTAGEGRGATTADVAGRRVGAWLRALVAARPGASVVRDAGSRVGARLRALVAAAVVAGCGGAPAVVSPPPPPGAPAEVAVWFVVQPAALGAALDGFERRLGDDPAGQLGPAGVAWARARAALADRLGDLAPAGGARDGWAAWGIDAGAPVRLAVAAPEGPALGRALVARLQGRAMSRPAVALRARMVARVVDRRRLVAGLDAVAGRLGLAVERGEGWRARDPETGARAALRVVGDDAVLDVALPAGEAAVDPTLPVEAPWPETPAAPIAAGVRPAGVAALEAALGATAAMAGVEARPAAAALPVLVAAAEVMAACTGRWSAAAGLVEAVVAAVDAPAGRPRVIGEVRLTARGEAAWAAARTTAPLASIAGLPAAGQAAVDPAAFRAAGGVGGDWWDEATACAAGAAAPAVAAGLWPAFADRLPMPTPPGGWPAPGRGFAAAITGAAAVDGAAVPALVGVRAVAADAPTVDTPLGPDADAVRPGLWASGGAVPVVFGDVTTGGRRAQVLALGRGGWSAIEPRLGGGEAGGALLDAALDPAALAAALAEAGEPGAGVAALAALGDRFGRWRLRADHAGRAVRFALEAGAGDDAATPAGAPSELDRPPGAQ
ncbi:MAG: hypothetical protein R3F65_22985 [bacterium]